MLVACFTSLIAIVAAGALSIMATGFRGVSAEQDGRFGDKQKKLLKSTKFPDSFNTRVDMSKVQVRMKAMAWLRLSLVLQCYVASNAHPPSHDHHYRWKR